MDGRCQVHQGPIFRGALSLQTVSGKDTEGGLGNLWVGGRKVDRNSIQQRVLYFLNFLYNLKLYVSGEVQRFKIFLMLSQKFANIGSFLQLSVRFQQLNICTFSSCLL